MSRQYHTSSRIGSPTTIDRKRTLYDRVYARKNGFDPENDMAGRWLAQFLGPAMPGPANPWRQSPRARIAGRGQKSPSEAYPNGGRLGAGTAPGSPSTAPGRLTREAKK